MARFTQWVRQSALVLSAFAVCAGASAGVTYVTANGKVTGALKVNVNGSFYDVAFGEGNIYNPAVQYDYGFASAATQALSEQVFTPFAPYNVFLDPVNIAGCSTLSTRCDVYTAFAWPPAPYWQDFYVASLILSSEHPGMHVTSLYDIYGGYLPSPYTVAVWAPVPESDTNAMMFAGLGVLASIARRRNAKQV